MSNQSSDPYAVLGIRRDADEQQMRHAYRRLAKRYHPDLHPGTQASERMRRVNDAWHVLSDPRRRARYDVDHPSVASGRAARPWPPTWSTAATAAGADTQTPGWATSAWTPPRNRVERPPVDHGSASGVPLVGLLAVLAVGWLLLGAIVGAFPLPLVLGFLVVAAVGSVVSRSD